jgi:hypothetical protein
VAGFITVLAVWLPGRVERGQLAELTWPLSALADTLWGWFGPPRALAWPWFAPVGTSVTVVVALLVNWVSKLHGTSPNREPQPGLDASR